MAKLAVFLLKNLPLKDDTALIAVTVELELEPSPDKAGKSDV